MNDSPSIPARRRGWNDWLLDRIESMSGMQVIVASLLFLAAVAVVDFLTGNEVRVFLFYNIAVALMAWRVSRMSGIVMAFICAGVWFAVDNWLRTDPNLLVESWNCGIHLATFLILAVLLSHIRATQDQLRRSNDDLRKSLARLEASMAESERLRKQVQTVCAWTKRIKDEGEWVSFEDFLGKHYGLQFTHGISEEAMKDLLREIEGPKPP